MNFLNACVLSFSSVIQQSCDIVHMLTSLNHLIMFTRLGDRSLCFVQFWLKSSVCLILLKSEKSASVSCCANSFAEYCIDYVSVT